MRDVSSCVGARTKILERAPSLIIRGLSRLLPTPWNCLNCEAHLVPSPLGIKEFLSWMGCSSIPSCFFSGTPLYLPVDWLTHHALHFFKSALSLFGAAFPGRRSPKLSSAVCRVKDGDSALSGEDIKLDQHMLEQELQVAIGEENYAKAAKIRDSLRSLQEDSKASLLATNADFYRSFKNGDFATMQAIWSKGDHTCCVHPGMLGISGYESVMDSWIHVWANYEFPLEIELREVRAHVRGDVGYVTCVELVKTKGSSWGGQFVTNVFERIDGQWFICIHHASPVDF